MRATGEVLPSVELGPPAFLPGELSNTIAHEEYHHYRPDIRDETPAYEVGDACAGPY